MEGLKPGRIVYYVLSDQDCQEITRRRTTSKSIADRIANGAQGAQWPLGAQAHIGNPVQPGDECLAMVLWVHAQEIGRVNLKVMLDGTDELRARSVYYSIDPVRGTWHWLFEGQAGRYDASKQR